ncbi:MAG TPA: hypothetical protein VM143_07350 [Acidimicrobiales bacterium]|nr:hypothetical protein [Acidimicrobiales bacterium]
MPAGSLPVGRRIGFDIDKAAFVRLSGTATTLKLVPHEDASGQRSADAAQLKACPITSTGWQKAEAQPMADAPKWDCTVSVLGKRAADGSWAFDLSVFPDRSDARGFALLPAGGPADYQVAFRLG